MGNLNNRTNDIDTKDENSKPVSKGRRADTSVEVDEEVKSDTRNKSAKHRIETKTESVPQVKGRHKIVPPITDPVNIAFLASKAHIPHHRLPVPQNKNKTLIAATTGGVLLAAMSTGTSVASQPVGEKSNTGSTDTSSIKVLSLEDTAELFIVADANVKLTNSLPKVTTVAAPPPPPVVIVPPKPKAAPVTVVPAKKQALAAAPPPPPKVAPIAVTAGNKASTIANAARAQLGRLQDCTRLVSNALAAAGVKFHGWPAGYLGLGTQVSSGQAVAGDLIYYANGGMGMAHIAVYIGNGQAVHGGWNGNQTVVFSANVGSGPVFIRVA